ncbi:alpha/beta hydrolase [Gordonia rubripertincta]|uniref:Alpha/beta hydrolase n=1 Tax=Gordonia rubripertincta TaxID=36822 RepID=A0ABT4MNN1_GORRU|nr:alpha/beta hydrolase [Gordonia rubripertincta]MCZ4548607.1 alpha/beta hydrolase [Gordonia rubripertincta]
MTSLDEHPPTQLLDPEFTAVVQGFPPLQFSDPAAQRAAFGAARATMDAPPRSRGTSLALADDVVSADGYRVPLRIHLSDNRRHDAPTLIWMHGGGYVVGSADEDDALCAHLAARLGIGVVSVDYRLAPEHAFPRGFEDCHSVALSVVGERPPGLRALGNGPVIIGGASAGAGLAAAVALRFRDEGRPGLNGQILLYPFIDSTTSSQSMRDLANSPIFNARDAGHCWDHYLGERRHNPPEYGSPSAAQDLTALPPALVVAAGLDCLHDEAVDYAIRLRRAGVPTELHSFAGVPHGFTGVAPWTRSSRRAVGGVLDAIRRFTDTTDSVD